MKQIRENIQILLMILPFIAFMIAAYSEYSTVKANVSDLLKERLRIEDKLDKISEKLNIIDGKISEHLR